MLVLTALFTRLAVSFPRTLLSLGGDPTEGLWAEAEGGLLQFALIQTCTGFLDLDFVCSL